ncbi:hypothetical protein F4861DRAFT_539127 [Xylaria intraflava]|nr:hypothetical protein F4861DRAFT_539127 [Xylaria intraflava]
MEYSYTNTFYQDPCSPTSQVVTQDQNASLWIMGLPSNITYNALLQSIRKAGRVKHTHIYRPDSRNPNACAVKLIFFSRDAAQRLCDQVSRGTFLVQGVAPIVTWNRFYTAEEPEDGRSRVLRIVGPSAIVNRKYLEEFWSYHLYWATDEVSDIGEIADGIAVVWYSFGGWLAQAGMARRLLLQYFGHWVTVTYETDPCEH